MAATTPKDLVLVTGGSGFLGAQCILHLLQSSYHVRTTLRSLSRSDEVSAMLKTGGASEDQIKNVEFISAELMKDDGWADACKGCTYVLHVASPFPSTPPKNADDLIVPAREGTLRVLRAAKESGSVRRVVVTGSFAAIGYGHADNSKPFTESTWTNLDNAAVAAYHRSKTLAERAAWDWRAKEGNEMELTVINPVGIFGPLLGKDYATSVELVVRLLNGNVPGLPNLAFGIVDVRDVADLHVTAMNHPKAAGERFIAVAGEGEFLSMVQIAESLRRQLGDKAGKVPTRTVPSFVLRLLGWFDPTVGMIVPELGKMKSSSNAKAREVLGWKPRGADEALKATGESLVELGIVK